jgi:phage-related holin
MNEGVDMIMRVLKEIFDFFCGDWRIFWGMLIIFILIELIEHFAILSLLKPFAGFILILGISASLAIALGHEMTE